MVKYNGIQLSPCIIAKARYALGAALNRPKNKKKCSKNYWEKVIYVLSQDLGSNKQQIDNAMDRYDEFVLNQANIQMQSS